ncbi:MAG TPA: alpha/beta fold hydrolase [Saprospiraceae bacterium]|nr:alpha/beta fold hydrolase [Saprospiraceae bacterium]
MKNRTTKVLLILFAFLGAGCLYLFTYVPPLSRQHGHLETRLFLGQGQNQPLIVAFGGGDGGNDWARKYLKSKRDSLLSQGYAVLAIGYFKGDNIPDHLDRISLNAIRDTILSIARHPAIDRSKIGLMGGSRGGELVLNLASYFPEFKAVVAMSAPNVSFPAITWSANTSSWMLYGQEVAYVPAPFKTIGPALKGDLFTAHSMMLEDAQAVQKAEIPVENIRGAVLLLSGANDDQWPAREMSDKTVQRLQQRQFAFPYEHRVLDGGHTAPLQHFELVHAFLDKHLK